MISTEEITEACRLLGITIEEPIGDGEVVTDVMLIVRTRTMDDMSRSAIQLLLSDSMDYVTQLGMLRWASVITDSAGVTS